MYKFGLVKDKGIFNTPSTDIYYKNHFQGYKPLQSVDVFGLISSTDNNFWLLSEDDDHYWTTAKVSEETLRKLKYKLENEDFTEELSLNGDLIVLSLLDLQTNKQKTRTFHKHWINSFIKTLDIDNPIQTKKKVLPVWDKSFVPDKINYPLMSIEEVVYSRILNYPTLYASSNFNLAKFRVLDQLFNVLGGGYDDLEDLIDVISKKGEIDIQKAKRYCVEDTYVGFSEVEEIDLGTRIMRIPKTETCVARNVFKEEKDSFDNVILWQKRSPNKKDSYLEKKGLKIETEYFPYPNFDKKYTSIWNNPEILDSLSPDWIKEIIWFYETSLEAINKGCFADSYQFPSGSKKEDENKIEEIKRTLTGLSNKDIFENFGVEFNGDMSDFLTRRWLKQKNEYETFINEMIDLLKSKI